MTTFICITIIVILVVILMSSIKMNPNQNKKSLLDILNEESQYHEMKELFETMQAFNEEGTALDTMPDGYGEFGYDVTNPIPVNTVIGSISYLGKLRTLNGSKLQYERVGSVSAQNIDQLIDEYIILENDNIIANLFLCPYNKKNSDRPPRGFKFSPIP